MVNKIQIKQIGSPIRRHHRQRKTLVGLGLNKIGRTVIRADTFAIRGMIAKVRHLVQIQFEPTNENKVKDSKLLFNEGLACDAIIRHLESIEGAQRSDIQWPEKQNHASPVEVVFKIGAKLYALEHTGIEPFEGHVGMTAQANRLFEPSERL
jgi:ribosomal protein L30